MNTKLDLYTFLENKYSESDKHYKSYLSSNLGAWGIYALLFVPHDNLYKQQYIWLETILVSIAFTVSKEISLEVP
jgi:hypothetical protein